MRDSSILPIREPFGVISGKTARLSAMLAFGFEFPGRLALIRAAHGAGNRHAVALDIADEGHAGAVEIELLIVDLAGTHGLDLERRAGAVDRQLKLHFPRLDGREVEIQGLANQRKRQW